MLVACAAGSCSKTTTAPTPVVPADDPPKLSCPSDVITSSPSGAPLIVAYGTPTATGGTPPVAIACTPESGTLFAVGSTTVTCRATDSKQRVDVCTMAVKVSAPATISVTRFLAGGDSMTLGEVVSLGSSRNPYILKVVPSAAYPTLLQNQLRARYTTQTVTIANAGIEGVFAEELRSLLLPSISSRQYEVLLLMAGANDLGFLDGSKIQPAIDSMRSIIRDATSRGMRVLMATLPPANPAVNGQRAALVVPYNDLLRRLAVSEAVTLVDVYTAFGGDTTTLIDFDGLHPTPAGYQRIADTFFRSITQTLEATPPVVPTRLLAAPPGGIPRR